MYIRRDVIWVFVDNEGPCTLNDNAFELTVAAAENCGLGAEVGQRFYQRMSVVDDIWGDFHLVPKDPHYSSGHTLKIILPFLKAMESDSRWLYDFSRQNVRVVPWIGEVLTELDRRYNVRIVSTSYDFFIQAFCDLIGFDFHQAWCTGVEGFDEIRIGMVDAVLLLGFMTEVAQMPIIEYDPHTGEMIGDHRVNYDLINYFIWERLYNMPVGKLLRAVKPIGQTQKRNIVELTCYSYRVSPERVMYVGDSQTDVQCVESLKGTGLSLAFNGKGRVCDLADLMYIGESALAIKEAADRFSGHGRISTISHYSPPRYPAYGGVLGAVTPETLGTLKLMSESHRKKFRGQRIGELT